MCSSSTCYERDLPNMAGKIAAAPGPIKAWFEAALAAGYDNYEAGTPGAGLTP